MTKTFSPSHFSGAIGIRVFRLKREDIENVFPICIPNDLLNMCSEPFVSALKGDGNPNNKYIYKKELFKPWILIPVSSKSVEDVEVMDV